MPNRIDVQKLGEEVSYKQIFGHITAIGFTLISGLLLAPASNPYIILSVILSILSLLMVNSSNISMYSSYERTGQFYSKFMGVNIFNILVFLSVVLWVCSLNALLVGILVAYRIAYKLSNMIIVVTFTLDILLLLPNLTCLSVPSH